MQLCKRTDVLDYVEVLITTIRLTGRSFAIWPHNICILLIATMRLPAEVCIRALKHVRPPYCHNKAACRRLHTPLRNMCNLRIATKRLPAGVCLRLVATCVSFLLPQ
eukprot:69637-Pleurochrysis_carterae.AAC.1